MLGTLCNVAAIMLGGIIGNLFKKKLASMKSLIEILGISIMFMSAVNVISNTITIDNNTIATKNILATIFALLIGNILGEIINLEEKICKATDKQSKSGFIAATMLFSIGGLQIIGPICSVLNSDNSVLISKALVDFPLAISLGAIFGSEVSFSSIPVGIIQIIVACIAYFARNFFTVAAISQLATIGYVILFFVGFNMVFKEVIRVKTNNMIPSIGIILIYNAVLFLGSVI